MMFCRKSIFGPGRTTIGYVPLVHKLSDANIHRNIMLSNVVVPALMDVEGRMIIISPLKVSFKYRYSTECQPDGCLKIEGWRQIVNECRPQSETDRSLCSIMEIEGFFCFILLSLRERSRS